jgi:hypothetical protein
MSALALADSADVSANFQGCTMTDTNAKADRDLKPITEPEDVVLLSVADGECFAQALLSPPQQSPALARAFDRRDQLLQTE